MENNASNIIAAMLVSPLMGPVMSVTFGTIISDRSLVRSGFESLVAGMFFSLVFGFIFGLILGTTEMPWGFGDWPTEEMKSRLYSLCFFFLLFKYIKNEIVKTKVLFAEEMYGLFGWVSSGL